MCAINHPYYALTITEEINHNTHVRRNTIKRNYSSDEIDKAKQRFSTHSALDHLTPHPFIGSHAPIDGSELANNMASISYKLTQKTLQIEHWDNNSSEILLSMPLSYLELEYLFSDLKNKHRHFMYSKYIPSENQVHQIDNDFIHLTQLPLSHETLQYANYALSPAALFSLLAYTHDLYSLSYIQCYLQYRESYFTFNSLSTSALEIVSQPDTSIIIDELYNINETDTSFISYTNRAHTNTAIFFNQRIEIPKTPDLFQYGRIHELIEFNNLVFSVPWCNINPNESN